METLSLDPVLTGIGTVEPAQSKLHPAAAFRPTSPATARCSTGPSYASPLNRTNVRQLPPVVLTNRSKPQLCFHGGCLCFELVTRRSTPACQGATSAHVQMHERVSPTEESNRWRRFRSMSAHRRAAPTSDRRAASRRAARPSPPPARGARSLHGSPASARATSLARARPSRAASAPALASVSSRSPRRSDPRCGQHLRGTPTDTVDGCSAARR
mmetsp:Transcript_183501/g.582069  ORF Transcript_183501/g.582069 Transcript_183501/m.582069 type:complete len:214 (+) Transcript_183501:32-673(+)